MSDTPERFFISEDAEWNADPVEPCMIEAMTVEHHRSIIATLTAELHKEEEECERMTLQAQALSSIVEQVADCLITEREEDGSPVWAGKSPSIWVLEKLKDIKQVATLAAERDHLQAIVNKAKRLMNECDGADIFEGWLKIEPLADQLFAALDND